MQGSWNQWGGTVNSGVSNYATNYPSAMPPPGGNFPSLSSSNQFPNPVTSALNSSAGAPAIPSQYPIGNSIYGQQSQQQQQHQQWQQWEQWQQQYAQWHQQYGDKYQGPVPTPGIMPTSAGFPSIPPLPPGAPTVQPPPPDSVPPPPEKIGDSNKRGPPDSVGKDETKKLKLGKGSKSENIEDLIEQEKTFDGQFKSWEASFLKWKEQNANHPDKVQYKEYEAKWESWREQLLQKREQLRKKRENKEAEVAAAAAAAKEAALATSNVSSNLQQHSYNNNMMNPNNPYGGMYSMPGVYPQDVMTGQPPPSYMSNFSMYNVPPPPSVPQMPGMPPVGMDSQNMKPGDGPKSMQSLEFLNSASSNVKSIPGLDLAGASSTDKNAANPSFTSNIPPNSSLFSYNQDVTKPLHTSDDKPFNFPPPPSQSNFCPTDGPRAYGRGRPTGGNSYDQFNKSSRFSQFDGGAPRMGSNQMDRNSGPSFDERFGGGNFNRDADSRFNNDYKYSGGGRNTDYRDEPSDKCQNKFGGSSSSSSYAPNFASDKFAKYFEDEYDDSRFRDPEPQSDNQQFNNRSNYQNRDNFGGGGYNNRQNFGPRSDNSFCFNDRGRDNFDRNRSAPLDRSKQDVRFESFGRGMKGNQFGRNTHDNAKEGFGRGDYNRGNNDLKLPEPSKPVSLLDLPPMKPPETFDQVKAPPENSDFITPPEDIFNSFPTKNNRFSFPRNESDQNFFSDKEQPTPVLSAKPAPSVKPALGTKPPFISVMKHETPKPAAVKDLTPPPEAIQPFVPSKIYEYDHISRNKDVVASIFEPVYVFDYSHGKKKVNDFVPDMTTSIVDLNRPCKVDELGWGEGLKDEVEKKVDLVPLPPRNRNSLADVLKLKLSENPPDNGVDDTNVNSEPAIDDNIIAQSTEGKTEGKRWINNARKDDDMFADDFEEKHTVKSISDILCPPGRHSRPVKFIIIMRGPPGSGKTYTAKLIKDKEIEMGGSAPRILSLDDYFTIENDVETTDPATGKTSSKREMQYEYDAALEPRYQESLLKSFKKTVSDGFFPFIIIDCVNDKVKNYEEMFNFAKSKGFQVYICEMDQDIAVCRKRNIHNRAESDISKIISEWEKTPFSQMLLDVQSLLQSDAVAEVDMTDVEKSAEKPDSAQNDIPNKEEERETLVSGDQTTENKIEETEAEASNDNEGLASYMEVFCSSKWEKMDNTEEKLDQLDGISKKRSSTSFKEWLRLPEESESDLSWYTSNAKTSGESSVSRKKRVRWADLEERVAQQKMRTIGFVVGQTDWRRMMDPSFGGNKLTETKYFFK